MSVIEFFIKCFLKFGDLIFDFFLGLGMIVVVVVINDWDYIGIELEYKYCDVVERCLVGVNFYENVIYV